MPNKSNMKRITIKIVEMPCPEKHESILKKTIAYKCNLKTYPTGIKYII